MDKQESFFQYVSTGDIDNVRTYLNHNDADSATLGHALISASGGGGNAIDIVKMLLSAKASPNWTNDNGITALMYAVMRNNIDIVQELLSAKADTDKADKDGMTALMFVAAQRDNSSVRPAMRRTFNLDAKARADMEKAEIAKMLLDARANKAEIAKMLLDAKANANAKNHENFAALHFAAESGNIYMAKVLLDGGANPDIKDNKGNTPLHIAAQKVNDGMVKTLLFGGANSMPKNNIGITPLDIAISNKSPHVERLLVMNKSSGKQSPDDVMANIRRMMSENSSPSAVGKCGNKDSFASEHDAKEKADIIHRKRGKNLRPYQCNRCNKWHLTSQPQR